MRWDVYCLYTFGKRISLRIPSFLFCVLTRFDFAGVLGLPIMADISFTSVYPKDRREMGNSGDYCR